MQHAQHTLGCTHGPTDPCPLALQVEEDLRARLLQFRVDASNANVLNDLHLTDKIAKKVVEKFPDDPQLKGKDVLSAHAHTQGARWPSLSQKWLRQLKLTVRPDPRMSTVKLLCERASANSSGNTNRSGRDVGQQTR